jgi:hypothetical protein
MRFTGMFIANLSSWPNSAEDTRVASCLIEKNSDCHGQLEIFVGSQESVGWRRATDTETVP